MFADVCPVSDRTFTGQHVTLIPLSQCQERSWLMSHCHADTPSCVSDFTIIIKKFYKNKKREKKEKKNKSFSSQVQIAAMPVLDSMCLPECLRASAYWGPLLCVTCTL